MLFIGLKIPSIHLQWLISATSSTTYASAGWRDVMPIATLLQSLSHLGFRKIFWDIKYICFKIFVHYIKFQDKRNRCHSPGWNQHLLHFRLLNGNAMILSCSGTSYETKTTWTISDSRRKSLWYCNSLPRGNIQCHSKSTYKQGLWKIYWHSQNNCF